MNDDFKPVLSALSEKLGMELDFADEEEIDLDIGGEVTLNIRKDDETDVLSLTAVVAEDLPDALDPSMMVELMDLALNPLVSGAPAIGRENESGMMIAYVKLPVRTIDPAEFPEIVEAFIDFSLVWKAKFRDMPVAEAGTDPERESVFTAIKA